VEGGSNSSAARGSLAVCDARCGWGRRFLFEAIGVQSLLKGIVSEFWIDGDFAGTEGAIGAHTALALVGRGVETDEEEQVRGEEGAAKDGSEFLAGTVPVVWHVGEVI